MPLTEVIAGYVRWFPVLKDGATEKRDDIPDIRMLTTDIALLMVSLWESFLTVLSICECPATFLSPKEPTSQFDNNMYVR